MDGKAMGTSILVYNSEEVKRKYRNFCLKFPWIKVHYAIMANPVIPLV
jgi:diaminopimelate decarboxylase